MKTKRTLIFSSVIMLLAFVVIVVGVSAAWFGDIKHAETSRLLSITSQRPLGEASIDLESAESFNEGSGNLVPAKAVSNWLLLNNTTSLPTGATLQTANAGAGIQTAATVVPIYFPFSYGGTPDSGAPDGKKAIRIYLDTAYLKIGGVVDNSANYLDDFYITLTVLKNVTKDGSGNITSTAFTPATAASDGQGGVTFTNLVSTDDSIYFINDVNGKVLYLLVPPDVDVYSVRVNISYNQLDEELNHATINKTIVFGVHIEVIERSALITAVAALL